MNRNARLSVYLKAMRIHQWAKNLLVFVPICVGHAFSTASVLAAVIAFFSFCFCASAVYLMNDWMDIDHDRAHALKQHRMIASGKLGFSQSIGLFCLLMMGALGLAVLLPWAFLSALGVYFALTLGYSLWLKQHAVIDVLTLACLYGIRLVAGAALGVELSEWLVAFSVFLFMGLALMKRCAELRACIAGNTACAGGRDYQPDDVGVLSAMAAASSYVAVLVLALYLRSPEVRELYSRPDLLWGACLILLYWSSRMLLLTARGRMDEDPVAFAVTDRTSLACAALLCTTLWAAT